MKSLNGTESLRELLERLERVTPETARVWGTMTPHQMVCHLNDSFKLSMGERSAVDISTPLTRTVVKWIAIYTPLPWPKGLTTLPEVNQQIGGTAPIEFWRDRDALVRTMTRFSAAERDFEWSTHPIFRRMSEREWQRWGYRHADHHLRQFGA
jgi:Protein of unknown function (DUF1569)